MDVYVRLISVYGQMHSADFVRKLYSRLPVRAILSVDACPQQKFKIFHLNFNVELKWLLKIMKCNVLTSIVWNIQGIKHPYKVKAWANFGSRYITYTLLKYKQYLFINNLEMCTVGIVTVYSKLNLFIFILEKYFMNVKFA